MNDVLQMIRRAEKVLDELCEGKREWTMSVPARPDHDPDLIVGEALYRARLEIERLRNMEDASREVIRALKAKLAKTGVRFCAVCDEIIEEGQEVTEWPFGVLLHADAKDCAASNEYRGRAA